MLIAISGTPGTGKSAVAQHLAKLMDANLIDINELVKEKRIPSSYDKERQTFIVDEEKLDAAVRRFLAKGKDNIVEGLLAHFVKADYVFVLRTNPKILEKRLLKKNWKKAKIRENIEAEAIGVITAEALDLERNVFEIDTSEMNVKDAADLIRKILNNIPLQKEYMAGKIDWLESFIKEQKK